MIRRLSAVLILSLFAQTAAADDGVIRPNPQVLLDQIADLKAQLQKKDKQIAELTERVGNKDKVIADLRDEVNALKSQLQKEAAVVPDDVPAVKIDYDRFKEQTSYMAGIQIQKTKLIFATVTKGKPGTNQPIAVMFSEPNHIGKSLIFLADDNKIECAEVDGYYAVTWADFTTITKSTKVELQLIDREGARREFTLAEGQKLGFKKFVEACSSR